MILFIKHIEIEGPETIGKFFENHGLKIRIVELQNDQKLPNNFKNLEAVISLGGPMNVYEQKQYPFLKEEGAFIQRILEAEIPFMGICLGSQLLAKACGAKVKKSPQREIGFGRVQLTEGGLMDPLFKGLDGPMDVYQWHEDMFEIPDDGELLAAAVGCPHQAFRVGQYAYGLQFHIEITDKSVREWSDKYIKRHNENERLKKMMLEDYFKKRDVFDRTAEIIYKNFLDLIKIRENRNKMR